MSLQHIPSQACGRHRRANNNGGNLLIHVTEPLDLTSCSVAACSTERFAALMSFAQKADLH